MHKVKAGQEHVNIITFYNEIFILAVKPFLMELHPSISNRQVHEDNNCIDGRSPGSPQRSLFPSLPDMSPKKVSGSHNVYVSPLWASKMDTLISSSSKSYYACIEESTHPYQSPSKDLSTINDRLNGRKVVRRLNVDIGLLYPQNGSCASSIGAASTVNRPLKFEQTDP